jgi:predicted nucleic acid-binding protein
MIAVADASPLCYLVLIGEIDLLPKLFLHVAVPPAVIAELLHEDAPEPVRTWASNLPAWLHVRENPPSVPAGLERLQVASKRRSTWRSPSSLTSSFSTRRPRAVLPLIVACGSLGSLVFWGEAATRGLVELAPAIDRLRRMTFRCSPALLKSTLERFGER